MTDLDEFTEACLKAACLPIKLNKAYQSTEDYKCRLAAIRAVLEPVFQDYEQLRLFSADRSEWQQMANKNCEENARIRTLLQRLVEQVDAIYTNATDTLDWHPASWHKENCQCPYHAAKRELESK